MKRTSTLFAFVATTLAAVAQIPNGGFETWTSMGGYNTPDGWDNLNAMTDPMSVYTCTKGTPGSPGTSCLKLTSKTVSGMGVAPGVAVSGVVDQTTFLPVSGFAFDQRPVSLTGKWQYMAFGADQGHIAIYLTRWNTVTNMRETVASKTQNLSGMAMSWANFTINLTYTSGDAPDSAMIVLAASGDSPVNGSYLWVDNLAFTGTVVGIEESSLSLAAVSIYPNPVTDNLTIDLGAGVHEDMTVQFIDAAGRVVRDIQMGTVGGTKKLTVNTAGMSKGVYQVKFTSPGSSLSTALVIQ